MRVLLFPAVLAVTLLFVGCAEKGGGTPGTVVLRLAHNQSVGHPYDLAARRFAEGVADATGGAVTVKIYPSSQLGDSSEQLEGLLLGALDFSIAAFPFASEFVREFGLFGAPFLFEDVRHFGAVFDGRVGAVLDSLARERYRIGLIGTLTSGERAFFNSARSVEDVSDLQGLKVRVMSGRADALTWQAFGAIPTPMPYSEVYSALQARVIDGAENDPASILANRFYEASPYLSLTNHLVLPMGIFASERVEQRVPEETWELIKREARKTAAWQQEYMEGQNDEAVRIMQSDYGVTVSHPDRAAFVARVTTLQDEVAGELDAMIILDYIRAERHAD